VCNQVLNVSGYKSVTVIGFSEKFWLIVFSLSFYYIIIETIIITNNIHLPKNMYFVGLIHVYHNETIPNIYIF